MKKNILLLSLLISTISFSQTNKTLEKEHNSFDKYKNVLAKIPDESQIIYETESKFLKVKYSKIIENSNVVKNEIETPKEFRKPNLTIRALPAKQ